MYIAEMTVSSFQLSIQRFLPSSKKIFSEDLECGTEMELLWVEGKTDPEWPETLSLSSLGLQVSFSDLSFLGFLPTQGTA